ncbi:MAG: sigma-70 family RNA polymerase sigma factor [Acidobacteria bacterium]|nr:sigma-70 family RNA polymerase sigma factor [Acidobacteriota bacterium]
MGNLGSEFSSTAALAQPQRGRERELVAAVLRKDRKATAEFVSLCADPVYRYVRRRLAPDQDVVEDVVQEVFMDAWESLPRYRGDSSLLTWILAITRHKVQDHYRRRLRRMEALDEEAPEPGSPAPALDEALLRQHEQERVETALSRLSEPYRLVLMSRYWESMAVAEIAAAMGKTEKAVERLLARARRQFKSLYCE